MANDSQYQVGAIVHITQTKDGYKIDQVETLTPPRVGGPKEQIPFKFDFGPVKISGWVDITSLAVHVEVLVLGISVGTYDFNLNNGLTLTIDLIVVSGTIRFYGKNGNELWMYYKLSSPLFNWEDDVKVLSW
ncbi:hypothetical protein F5Y03DRAFT_336375 [Xylaria venustula]|nr:hypothetical protein F5Y03DRAFT_336375 [Xylaria venustula]